MSFDLEALRAEVSRLAVRSEDGRLFYPEPLVAKVMTTRRIREALSSCISERIRQREAITLVTEGGQNLFTLLVLIGRLSLLDIFVDTHTTLEKQSLDARLPIAAETLLHMFTKEANSDILAKTFFDKQWEVIAPVFRLNLTHRTFSDMQILPFLFNSVESVGEGAFGYVERVKLHGSHHSFPGPPLDNTVIIRKCIKQRQNDSYDLDSTAGSEEEAAQSFHNEARILSLLRLLKHPCVIELLGSYTYRQKHYLLFPPADCSLADAFVAGRLTSFENHEILEAIIGLCSAIKRVHSYFSDDFQLNMIGCHHDLTPKNILVSGKRFLLADFGLSRLEEREDSKSIFKTGNRSYVAPECEMIEDSDVFIVRKGIIGRAADIWSLGGILTEIVTCKLVEPHGFKTYRNVRKKTLQGNVTVCQFHKGGQNCEEVQNWIDSLKEIASADMAALLDLATSCLTIEPSRRPRIDDLLSGTNHILHSLQAKSALREFDSLILVESYLSTRIEHERLKLWCLAIGLLDETFLPSWYIKLQEEALERVRAVLKLVKVEILSLREAVENPLLVPVITSLKELIGDLWSILPDRVSDNMEQRLISRVLEAEEDQLDTNQQALEVQQTYPELGLYMAMKHVITRLNRVGLSDHNSQSLHLNDYIILNRTDLGLYKTGVMRKRNAANEEVSAVLLEQVEYDEVWADQGHRDELLERVAAIASLLQRPFLVPQVRLLKCLGYQHDLDYHSITLIYELRPGRPRTFRQFLNATNENRRLRPMLGSAFRFAYNIAQSIMQYHIIGWLHKNIAADNLLLFPPSLQPQAMIASFEEPYLIGFNQSRQSGDEALSHGPKNIQTLRHYVHPEYLASRPNRRFHWHYDYYSLGILLLEIGLWRCVSDWTGSERWKRLKLPPVDLRRKILDDLVPILGNSMGRTYMAAVNACLTADFQMAGNDLENVTATFKELVLNPLSTLLDV